MGSPNFKTTRDRLRFTEVDRKNARLTLDTVRRLMANLPPHPHAYPPETPIEKINSEPGDGFPDGTRGKVVLCFHSLKRPDYGYFVIWDALPGFPIFVASTRVKAVA